MALADINSTTIANLISQSADAQEVLWVRSIAEEAPRYNPFADLMGGFGTVKPIKDVIDTQKVAGQEIVFTAAAGLGGKGVQGSNVLLGNEEKLKSAQYRLFIGRHRHAAAYEDLVKDQTVVGKPVDNLIRNAIRVWMSRLKCDAIEACMIGESESYSTVYANSSASLNALGSVDYLNEETIMSAKQQLSGIGGEPISIAKDKGNQMIEKFYYQGPSQQFAGLRENGAWKGLLATAGERGPTNYVFGGNLPEYDGVLLNSWNIKRTSSDAAQGAFCAPEAQLGVEIVAKATNATISASIKGGGFQGNATLTGIAAAKTLNDYFRYFPNAPFQAFDRVIISSAVTRQYALIQHFSGADKGKFSIVSYTTCDGFQLGAANGADIERLGSTVTGSYVTTLTGSRITWGTAPWTTGYLSEGLIPIGSLIVPCNDKGQPWVRGYMIANNAIVTGYGSINGMASGAFGQRISEKQDYGAKLSLGAQLVWGVKAIEDAAKIKAGYVLTYSARQIQGMPEIDHG